MSNESNTEYLLKQGWREANTLSPWRWYDPKYPGARYRVKDAITVAQGLAKEKRGKS